MQERLSECQFGRVSCTPLDFCRNDGVVCACAVPVTGRVDCVIVCVRGGGGWGGGVPRRLG